MGSQGAFCSFYLSFSQPQDFLSLIFVFSLCPKHGSGVGATPQVDVCSCQKKFLVTKSAINFRAEHCLKIKKSGKKSEFVLPSPILYSGVVLSGTRYKFEKVKQARELEYLGGSCEISDAEDFQCTATPVTFALAKERINRRNVSFSETITQFGKEIISLNCHFFPTGNFSPLNKGDGLMTSFCASTHF